MLKIREYVKAKSLDEAYELNQKKGNVILGGMLWLKMQNKTVGTAIDLSGLGLDTIEENEGEIRIGAMVTLRQLELHEGFHAYTRGMGKEALKHIVGVQFRNCATVGGSVFGRFGFSDVLTLLLAMDSYVELYQGGIVPLEQFVQEGAKGDILVRVIVKKKTMAIAYLSQRNTKTDFPVLTCAVSEMEEISGGSISGNTAAEMEEISGGSISGNTAAEMEEISGGSISGNTTADNGMQQKTRSIRCVIGARPGRAVCFSDEEGILAEGITEEGAAAFGTYIKEQLVVGSNMRAGAEYRRSIAAVLVKRALLAMEE